MTPRQIVVRALQVTRLNRLAHRIYYRHLHGFQTSASTLKGLGLAFEKASELGTLDKGDYYEFGLFKGYSFWWAQKTARELGAGFMRFFGFDSFEGLPEVQGRDLTGSDDFYKGQYACSYEQVQASLDRAGVDWDRTVLIRGYYNESLKDELRTRYGMRPVVIGWIDCDLYSSTVDVLRFIGPLLMDLSVVVFDDWNCFRGDSERGQRKAASEFLEQHREFTLEKLFAYGSWGQGFLVHRHPSLAQG